MSNTVYNILKVTKGDPQQVWDAIRGRRDGDYGTPITFNRLIPMPADIRNCGVIGTQSELADKIIASRPLGLDDDYEYFVNEELRKECEDRRYDYRATFEIGMKRKKNREKYGYADWYDWSCANWGTKWNAGCGKFATNDKGETLLTFGTAWSRPYPVMEKLFAMFPEHEFEYLTDSVENDIWSTDIVRGGKIVEHKGGHYDYDGIKPYEPFTVEELKRIPVDEINTLNTLGLNYSTPEEVVAFLNSPFEESDEAA
jgi:hypothetical protein